VERIERNKWKYFVIQYFQNKISYFSEGKYILNLCRVCLDVPFNKELCFWEQNWHNCEHIRFSNDVPHVKYYTKFDEVKWVRTIIVIIFPKY